VVLRSSEQRVKIGVVADNNVAVARGELLDKENAEVA
jgi:sRNA-binding carbon storage regulator CsrA